jgi:lysozyme
MNGEEFMAFNPANTTDTVIDVSHYQLQIDWGKVGAAGKTVAMIKACQGVTVDPKWVANQSGASAAGILIIPYLFVTNEDTQAQIDAFTAATGLAANMPVALDWEGNGAPHADVVETIGVALKGATTRDPLGYWGLYPPGNATATMQTWPRWIPRYGDNTGVPDQNHTVDVPWLFWQYTSTATVGGITTGVDASMFSGTPAELIGWCNSGTLPA